LIVYARYVEGTTLNEEVLFCKPIKRRSTVKELFKISDDFKKERSIKW
jgi:hypothetical protein